MSSTAAELAREEADRVEQEAADAAKAEGVPPDPDAPPEPEPESEPDEQSEPEPTPEPEALSEQQIEQRMKAWDRERDRHMRELGKRDPNRYQASDVCPLCDGHGLYLTELDEPSRSARIEFVVAALGGAAAPEYKVATDKVTCDACDGWGKTTTGSKVPEQAQLPCAACNGQGWKYAATAAPAVPQWNNVPVPNLVAPAAPPAVGPLDAWQRPVGHPHYGRDPREVGA